jgi:glutamate--cysteine ligase
VTLIDDDIAADRAADICRPVRDAWLAAAHDGLADTTLAAAVTACVELAAERCVPELKAEVEAYAELIRSGRTPGDEVRDRALEHGPLRVLEEEGRA